MVSVLLVWSFPHSLSCIPENKVSEYLSHGSFLSQDNLHNLALFQISRQEMLFKQPDYPHMLPMVHIPQYFKTIRGLCSNGP